MIHTADWYVLFVFGCSLLGLLVSGVLFFANKDTYFPARMMAGFLTSLSLVGLNNALMATDFFSQMPHMWRAVSFTSFLPAPFSFLYVRSVLNQEFRFRRHDWLFFVPAVLYALSMLPFYLQPAGVKMELINQIVANNDLIAQEPENLIPGGISTLARTFYGLGTSIAMVVLLKRWKKRLALDQAHRANNLALYRWLVLFTMVVWLFYLTVFFVILSHLNEWLHVWELVAFIISITVLFIGVSLLARPSILYGMRGWLQNEAVLITPEQSPKPVLAQDGTHPVRKTTLSVAQGNEIRETIENYLAQKKPYLRPNYKLADLSQEAEIPTYLLSAFINQQYGKNFNEFINDHRVDYLFGLLQNDKVQFEHYTLEALGKKAGFNSRNAFIASVKRKTGMTPSEFYALQDPA
jgi:AraC-like DNA-binding protein/bacteriorhodopsin